ncbi:MAG TPA: carboxypeptidase regulatory-like domain-containing protein, partial [Bryobacteraceae bacterium]
MKDPSGAVVPAAQVTITNEATNQTMTSKTDSNGSYTFTPIPVGVYTVTASDSGFQKTVHTHVTVNIQEQTVANLTLVPGNVTQTVSVTAEPPLLQTQNASVQQVVTSKAINDLPLNGRNATYLARLDAGVTPAHNSGRGLTDSGSFSANGFGSLQNNYLLDGIDDNAEVGDLINQTQYVVMPPPDAVSEFTVQTNNYSAEFGHAAGAVLNATTKSGTNRLQGDLWEFIRNDHLDGTPFFLNAAGQQKAEYRLNQFGFTLGGPVVVPHIYHGRNKTFFFGYYQGTRIREGSTAVSTVPTVAERASGFTNFQDLIAGQSGTRKDILGRSFPLGTIFDPATTRAITKGQIDPVTGLMAPSTGYVRDPFYRGSLNGVTNFTTPAAEGLLNVIPANRLDPNAIKLVNLYPQPTGSSLLSNYTSAPIDMNDEDQGGIRIDQYFGENDRMFGSYALSDVVSTAPGPFPGLADGQANRPGSGTTTARNWAVSETHIFSPTFINEARFGYSRLHDVRLQLNGDDLSNIPA